MSRYTLEAGRSILRDGKAFIHIQRTTGTEWVEPSDVDDVTRTIVARLNGLNATGFPEDDGRARLDADRTVKPKTRLVGHEEDWPCDEGCEGLFVDGETFAVTRCDTCKRFEDDEDAAALVDVLVNLLYAVHRDAKSATVADALDELVKRAGVRPHGEDAGGR